MKAATSTPIRAKASPAAPKPRRGELRVEVIGKPASASALAALLLRLHTQPAVKPT